MLLSIQNGTKMPEEEEGCQDGPEGRKSEVSWPVVHLSPKTGYP